jgi:FlaA1/EpsC-like NDP-sugar epimerase
VIKYICKVSKKLYHKLNDKTHKSQYSNLINFSYLFFAAALNQVSSANFIHSRQQKTNVLEIQNTIYTAAVNNVKKMIDIMLQNKEIYIQYNLNSNLKI